MLGGMTKATQSHTQLWRFRRGYEYHCKVLGLADFNISQQAPLMAKEICMEINSQRQTNEGCRGGKYVSDATRQAPLFTAGAL